MLEYFESLETERELIPIEKRMKRSITREIEEEGISKEQLLGNRNWNMDGLDVRSMLRKLDCDHLYPFMYGGASRWVHGGWSEFRRYHLVKNDGSYKPRLDYGDPDPRIPGPVTQIHLELAKEYLDWAESDPDAIVSGVIDLLLICIDQIGRAHV